MKDQKLPRNGSEQDPRGQDVKEMVSSGVDKLDPRIKICGRIHPIDTARVDRSTDQR